MKKFCVLGEYDKDISLDKLLDNLQPTKHMEKERLERYDDALNCLDEDDRIEKVFVVDTGHKDGEELHCITQSGIIFILNRQKHEAVSYSGLVTILIARVGQLERYRYKFSEYTRRKAIQHQREGLNI
ncbi:MAG: hypothetical protein K2O29_03575 [Ruminococcus sp.]|nr:hypothetical protein [Ruminococcus sp.]MDE6849000.1 hypothetical protein [Ruminococcus sp.]MDE7137524.1 hypothetical protein [Ruminococcus sp.]